MKFLAWILTAAVFLVGADVFVKSTDGTFSTTDTSVVMTDESPTTLQGGNGMPTPPTD
jgi:hypothetical protein